jgi:hypothetical protein
MALLLHLMTMTTLLLLAARCSERQQQRPALLLLLQAVMSTPLLPTRLSLHYRATVTTSARPWLAKTGQSQRVKLRATPIPNALASPGMFIHGRTIAGCMRWCRHS